MTRIKDRGIFTIVFFERTPHEVVRSMGARVHRRNYYYRYDSSHNDEEHAAVLRIRNELVRKDDEKCRDPQDADVCDVDVPRLWHIRILMVSGIHLNEDVGRDLN